MSERIRNARAGYKKKDLMLSKKAHTQKQIQECIHSEEHQEEKSDFLGPFVYGALDGLVTTFAVVAGVAGAELSSSIVLIMGFANLFADGVSMAMGSYLSSKSEQEYEEQERQRELWEIEHLPEAERQEVREIFRKKGFQSPLLERVVEVITNDKEVWVNTMLTEELHIYPEKISPVKKGFATFFAFVLVGFFPLLSYVLSFFFPLLKDIAFLLSIFITGVTLFVVGSLRTFLIGRNWWRAGLEMFLVGSAAATIAYIVGKLLEGLA